MGKVLDLSLFRAPPNLNVWIIGIELGEDDGDSLAFGGGEGLGEARRGALGDVDGVGLGIGATAPRASNA
jgi:hypothetical protein